MTSQDFSSESTKFKPFTGECAKLPPDEDTEYWAGRYGFALSPSDGEGMEDENKVTIDDRGRKVERGVQQPRESRKEAKKKRKRSTSSSSSSSADRADVKALEDAARAALESQVKVSNPEELTENTGSKPCKILKDLIVQYKSAIADKVPPRSDVYNQYMREKAKDATMQAQFESAKGCKNKRESLRTEWLQNVVEVKKTELQQIQTVIEEDFEEGTMETLYRIRKLEGKTIMKNIFRSCMKKGYPAIQWDEEKGCILCRYTKKGSKERGVKEWQVQQQMGKGSSSNADNASTSSKKDPAQAQSAPRGKQQQGIGPTTPKKQKTNKTGVAVQDPTTPAEEVVDAKEFNAQCVAVTKLFNSFQSVTRATEGILKNADGLAEWSWLKTNIQLKTEMQTKLNKLESVITPMMRQLILEQGDMTNVKRGNRSAGMDQMNLTVEQMQQPIKDLEDCNSRANAIHALVVSGGSSDRHT